MRHLENSWGKKIKLQTQNRLTKFVPYTIFAFVVKVNCISWVGWQFNACSLRANIILTDLIHLRAAGFWDMLLSADFEEGCCWD